MAAVKSKKTKVARLREPDSYDEGGDELSSSSSENSGKEELLAKSTAGSVVRRGVE